MNKMRFVLTSSVNVPELFYFNKDFNDLLLWSKTVPNFEMVNTGFNDATYDGINDFMENKFIQIFLIGNEKIYSLSGSGVGVYDIQEYDLITDIVRNITDFSTVVINKPYLILRYKIAPVLVYDGIGADSYEPVPPLVLTNANKAQFIIDLQKYLDGSLFPAEVYTILGSKFINRHTDFVAENAQGDLLQMQTDSVTIKASIDALLTSVSGVQNVMSEILVQLGTNNNLLTQINNKVG